MYLGGRHLPRATPPDAAVDHWGGCMSSPLCPPSWPTAPPPQRRLQGSLQRTQPQLQALDLVPELVAENSKNVSSQDVELKRGAGWSGKEDVCACCAVGWC